jgi:uncharacterized protein YqhQ
MAREHDDLDHAHDDGDGLHLAGMALRNGVLVIGPTHWAAAVRGADGEIRTASRPRRSMPGSVDRVPGLRGPVRLAEMVAVLPALRRALPESRFAFEAPLVVGSSIGGAILARAVRRQRGDGAVVELIGSGVSLVALLGALKGGDIARYHGAEHKVIGAYEQGIAPEDASKEHERCGTHLAVPMLVANALALQLARLLLPGRPQLARTVGSLIGISTSVELTRAARNNPKSRFARTLVSAGMGLQSMASTEEPTPDQLAVAKAALAALFAVEPEPAAA